MNEILLEKILRYKREHLPTSQNDKSLLPSSRDFLQALQPTPTKPLHVIAEFKPASPSLGILQTAHNEKFDHVRLYLEGGASAISVVTEETIFHGDIKNISLLSSQFAVPFLCKDFMIDPCQILEARAHGADACLLIAAILTDAQLVTLKKLTEYWQMSAVIEVHTEKELTRVLSLQPKIILINNRNLFDLTMHMDTVARLAALIPEEILIIAASGYEQPEDIKDLPKQVGAVLIGSALMRVTHPEQLIRAFLA